MTAPGHCTKSLPRYPLRGMASCSRSIDTATFTCRRQRMLANSADPRFPHPEHLHASSRTAHHACREPTARLHLSRSRRYAPIAHPSPEAPMQHSPRSAHMPGTSCASGSRCSQSSIPNQSTRYNVHVNYPPSNVCKSLTLQDYKKVLSPFTQNLCQHVAVVPHFCSRHSDEPFSSQSSGKLLALRSAPH
jgi:hypothetical protein